MQAQWGQLPIINHSDTYTHSSQPFYVPSPCEVTRLSDTDVMLKWQPWSSRLAAAENWSIWNILTTDSRLCLPLWELSIIKQLLLPPITAVPNLSSNVTLWTLFLLLWHWVLGRPTLSDLHVLNKILYYRKPGWKRRFSKCRILKTRHGSVLLSWPEDVPPWLSSRTCGDLKGCWTNRSSELLLNFWGPL